MGLSRKQELFCIEYVKCFDEKKAAIKAGYNKQTASKRGRLLLTYPQIKEHIEKLQEEARLRNHVGQDYFIQELKQINEESDSSGRRINKVSDRISALTLLAKITGHLKENLSDSKQIVVLQQTGFIDDSDSNSNQNNI